MDIQADYDQQIRKIEGEVERYKDELTKKDEEIEKLNEDLSATLSAERSNESDTTAVSDSEISNAIRKQPYRLQFNPKKGKNGSKLMMFGPDGKILEGSNDNEHSWRASNGKLELMNKDGEVFSRFNFDLATSLFLHTNDPDTLSIKGQYLTPEPGAAQ